MDFGEIFSSAITAVLANRMRSFLTVLGIVIGVMSVILLVALVSGLKTYITSEIQGLGSNLIFVIPGSIGGGRGPGGVTANKLTFQDATNLKTKLSGQALVSAIIQKTGTLKYSGINDKNATVFGIEANFPNIISIKLTQGRYLTQSEAESGRRVAVVGPTVVNKLFLGTSPLGKELIVEGLKYQVIGVTVARGSTFGVDQDNTVLLPLSAAQRQFGLDRPNTIYISANQANQVADVKVKSETVLKKRLTEDDFTVMTQEQTLSTISQITGVLSLALGGIAAISLLVGGIGITNIMLVSVTERTREIGLRKALGAQPSDIRNQFIIEAIVLSGLGGLIGIILGIIFSLILGRFITTTITWWSILLSFGFSMLVGVIFGVAPAIRAAKLNPIEALRYE